jgi:enolase-phosphatase E1
VTIDLARRGLSTVLLDIEGTTTPIAFVHDVLFPFARAHLAAWCRDHAASTDYRDVVARLAAEHARDSARGEQVPRWTADAGPSIQAYVHWLMDRDRKSPGLKLLQGLIWEQGYQSGALRGEVFEDVPTAMRRWHHSGVRIAVYSSGSELAQRRLFQSTPYGDLTALVTGFFDTAVGPKSAAASYERIASTLGQPPATMLFVSDVVEELAAARQAGCQAVLSVRPGNVPQPAAGPFDQVTTFEEIC